jgi:4-deoxy-L-threo-5-hexosulose-uronate ketol-isomerase
MQTRYLADQIRYQRMNSDELRDIYLVDDLFQKDKIILHYSEIDRTIVGSAVPVKSKLALEASKELAVKYFAQRREVGVINIGGTGQIDVDDNSYIMDSMDGLYIGRGSKEITLLSKNSGNPAQFYILSYPAHTDFPIKLIKKNDAEPVKLGSDEACNKRVIYKYIHPNGVKSCQLVMGFTELAEGSVWNTMPTHTHERRTEVYFYFNVADDALVFHLMGMPKETRHIIVKDKQAILSPSWSIHSGVGTKNYSFIWGMGGENQDFDDMDFVEMKELG